MSLNVASYSDSSWHRAIVIDEYNDTMFVYTASEKVYLNKNKWISYDKPVPKVGDFIEVQLYQERNNRNNSCLTELHVKEYRPIRPFMQIKIVNSPRKGHKIVQLFTNTYEQLHDEEPFNDDIVPVYRTEFFERVYDVDRIVKSPYGTIRFGEGMRGPRRSAMVIYAWIDESNDQLSSQASSSVRPVANVAAESEAERVGRVRETFTKAAFSMPPSDPIPGTTTAPECGYDTGISDEASSLDNCPFVRTAENKKRDERESVAGIIVTTDNRTLSICHIDKVTLQPYFIPFPKALWTNFDSSARTLRDLLGRWVGFVMDEWECIAEDEPICPINVGFPVNITAENNVEVLTDISYDGSNCIGDKAVVESDIGHALDFHGHIHIDGRPITRLTCWLRCEKYNRLIGWRLERIVDDAAGSSHSNSYCRDRGESYYENTNSFSSIKASPTDAPSGFGYGHEPRRLERSEPVSRLSPDAEDACEDAFGAILRLLRIEEFRDVARDADPENYSRLRELLRY